MIDFISFDHMIDFISFDHLMLIQPAPPASSCSNPIVGGIYPAAYVQNALSQVSSTVCIIHYFSRAI